MKNPALLHVLVVDDEPLIRWSISETLAHAGHAVTEAGDAKQTLGHLTRDPAPDVILLDYRLPDSNDLKLLERIKQLVPDSPVIMMTAYGAGDVVAGAARLGAFRILNKPVEMDDLVPLIEQAFASRTPVHPQ